MLCPQLDRGPRHDARVEAIVGLGTLGLAVATFVLAGVAWRTLDVTRFSIQQSYRPVIVSDTTSRQVVFRGGIISDAAAGPALHKGQLIVPIQNTGAGPALNIRGGAETRDNGAVRGSGWTTYPIEGLSAGHSNAIVLEPLTDDLRPRSELVVRLLYEDIAGLSDATDLYYKGPRVVRSKFRKPPIDRSSSPLVSDEVNAQLVL